MKTNLTFRSLFLVFLMAVLIFTAPFTTLAQQNSVEVQAKMAAERDAKTDVNGALWFIIGVGASSSGTNEKPDSFGRHRQSRVQYCLPLDAYYFCGWKLLRPNWRYTPPGRVTK